MTHSHQYVVQPEQAGRYMEGHVGGRQTQRTGWRPVSFLAFPRLRLDRRPHRPGSWRLTGEDEARILEPHHLTVRAWTTGTEPISELPADLETTTARWIDIASPDTTAVSLLRDQFHLGSLSVEHLLQPARMPKLDVLPDGGAVAILFLLQLEEGDEPRIHATPVGFLIRARFLLTLHRGPIAFIERRLQDALHDPTANGIRLAALAIDALVDEHLTVTLRSAELAEELEEQLDPDNELESLTTLERLIVLRRDLLAVRRLGVAQQEVIRRFARLFPDEAATLEDVITNQREAIETATAVCDYIDGAIEAYRLRREARTEIGIRRLTVLASLFGVVSIVMGLWGVNFVGIPGSESRWGWFVFVGALFVLLALGIWYVRRRGLW